MSRQQIILSFYSDLCRAATSFYLNPYGKTHQIFLRHALNLLQKENKGIDNVFIKKLEDLLVKTNRTNMTNTSNPSYLADSIFTLGMLLKYS